MSAEHVAMFLRSMEEPEMADEVLNMHNRLEAFASGLDRDCMNTMADRIAELERQNAELRKALHDLLNASLEQIPSFESGKEAQDAWADRGAAARNNASAALAQGKEE